MVVFSSLGSCSKKYSKKYNESVNHSGILETFFDAKENVELIYYLEDIESLPPCIIRNNWDNLSVGFYGNHESRM